jgi:Ca2+-binding EF-hand superfamily protein
LIIMENRVNQIPKFGILKKELDKEMDEGELKVLIDLFNAYDTDKTGKIKAENIYEVASMLGKEAQHGNTSL